VSPASSKTNFSRGERRLETSGREGEGKRKPARSEGVRGVYKKTCSRNSHRDVGLRLLCPESQAKGGVGTKTGMTLLVPPSFAIGIPKPEKVVFRRKKKEIRGRSERKKKERG